MNPIPTTSVSIVLPVHQQADHIAQIVSRLYGAGASLTDQLELIVVVNGSTDQSAQICRDLIPNHPGLRVIERKAGGWGASVRAGLAVARGDLLCFTNAARTNEVDLRNAIVLGILNEGHAIKAVRRSRDSLRRRLGSVLYNFEARALFGLASWDLNGTPKVFPRSFEALLQLEESGDLLDLEWLVTCSQQDYPLIEIPTTSTRRHGGRSTTGMASAVKMYTGAIALRYKLRRYRAGLADNG